MEKFWNPLGAISTFIALFLYIVVERKRISEEFSAIGLKPLLYIQAIGKILVFVGKRGWRVFSSIISLWLLVVYLPKALLLQLKITSSQWYYLLLIIPIMIIIFVIIIDPWLQINKKKNRENEFVSQKLNMVVTAYVFFDDSLPCSWVKAPEQAAAYFVKMGFTRISAVRLGEVMESMIKSGTAYKSLIVFINDIAPTNIVQVVDPTCTLRRYLESGGRIVWWGDIPLHVKGLPGNMKEQWAAGPNVLSVNHYIPLTRNKLTGITEAVLWSRPDLDSQIHLTEAGKAIGLTSAGSCERPAAVSSDTIVYSEISGELGFGSNFQEFRWAISYRKVYNKEYPHSGFMQYPLTNVSGTDIATVSDYYRFAVSDWTLAPAKR